MALYNCFTILTALRLVVDLHSIAEKLVARVLHGSCVCCALWLRLNDRACHCVSHFFHLTELLRNLDAKFGDWLIYVPCPVLILQI